MFKVHVLGSISSPNMDLSTRNKRLREKWEAIWNRNNDPGWLSAPESQVCEWGHLGSFSANWALSADIMYTAAAAESLQSCPTLFDPIDGSPPGSPVPGILQARLLEWVAISFSNAWKWKWSRSVVSDSSMDCSPQGSSVHGIFQARGLEWGATASSGYHVYMIEKSHPDWFLLEFLTDRILRNKTDVLNHCIFRCFIMHQ